MSWLVGDALNQVSAFAKDVISEGIEEDDESNYERALHAAKRVEEEQWERISGERDQARENAESAELQIASISQQYRTLLIEKEEEVKKLQSELFEAREQLKHAKSNHDADEQHHVDDTIESADGETQDINRILVLQTQIKKLTAELKASETEASKWRQQAEFLSEKGDASTLAATNHELEEKLRVAIDQHQDQLAAMQTMHAQSSKASEDQLEHLRDNCSALEQRVEVLEGDIEEKESLLRISRAGKSPSTDELKRIESDHEMQRETLSQKILSMEAQIKSLESMNADYKSTAESAEAQFSMLMTQKNAALNDAESLRHEVSRILDEKQQSQNILEASVISAKEKLTVAENRVQELSLQSGNETRSNETVTELEVKLQEKENLHLDLQAQISDLQSQLNSSSVEAGDWQTKFVNIQDQLRIVESSKQLAEQNFAAQLSSADEHFRQTSKSLTEAKAKYEMVCKELDNMKVAHSTASEQETSYQAQLSELQGQLQVEKELAAKSQSLLTQNKEEMQIMLAKDDKQRSEAQNEIRQLKLELESNKQNFVNAEQEVSSIAEQLSATQTALNDSQNALHSANATIDELRQQVSEARAAAMENSADKSIVEASQTALDQANINVRNLESENAQLKESLSASKSTSAGLETQVTEANEMYQLSIQNCESLSNKIVALEKEKETMHEVHAVALSEAVGRSSTDASLAQQDVAALEAQVNILQGEMQEKIDQLAELQDQVVIGTRRVQQLEDSLKSEQGSRAKLEVLNVSLSTNLESAKMQFEKEKADFEAKLEASQSKLQSLETSPQDHIHEQARSEQAQPVPNMAGNDQISIGAVQTEKDRLASQLSKLQAHLLSIEEQHTEETMELGQEVERLQAEILVLKQSNQEGLGEQTALVGELQGQVKTTKKQMQLAQKDLERASQEMQRLENENTRLTTVVGNLELALDGFQNDKDSTVEALKQRSNAALVDLQSELFRTKAELEKYAGTEDVLTQRDAQVKMLESELNMSSGLCKSLEMDVGRLQRELSSSQARLGAAESAASTNTVDKEVVRNMVVSYCEQSGEKKQQALNVLAHFLEFSDAEKYAAGIRQQRGFLASLLSGPSVAPMSERKMAKAPNFAESLVNFMMEEAAASGAAPAVEPITTRSYPETNSQTPITRGSTGSRTAENSTKTTPRQSTDGETPAPLKVRPFLPPSSPT